jgi:hypothetical protein
MHRAGLFSGAARCNILWPDAALRQISRGRLVRAKATPLRALGTNKPCRRANRFEDEDDEYEDERDNALDLPNQPLVRLNVIHVANDVIVIHLDRVNFFWVTFDHPFAAYISGNPQD